MTENGWRELRRAVGMTLSQASKATELKVTRISDIELGDGMAVELFETEALAKAYGAHWRKLHVRLEAPERVKP